MDARPTRQGAFHAQPVRRRVLGSGAPTTAFPSPDDVSAANGLVYFVEPGVQGSSASGLVATDPASGAVVWSGLGNQSYAVSSNVIASVIQSHGTIFGNGLDPRTGRVLWGPAAVGEAPAIAGSMVFSTGGGTLVALDSTNGKLAGSFKPPNENLTSPVTPSNGLVYAGSSQHLYALAPSGS